MIGGRDSSQGRGTPRSRRTQLAATDVIWHRPTALPALLERPVDQLAAAAAHPAPMRRMAQFVQQARALARAGRHPAPTAPAASDPAAPRRRCCSRTGAAPWSARRAWLNRSAHSVASARFGAVVRRFIRWVGRARRRQCWHDSAPTTSETCMTASTSPTIRVDRHGGPEEMHLVDLPVGDPGPGEIRIRHHACGLNFIDVYQRSGVYQLPMPLSLGMEGAGVVEAVGAGVTHLKAGDRAAYASNPPGSYCTRRVMSAKCVVKLPDAISFETGAAMMLKGLTAQYLLRKTLPQEGLQAGDYRAVPCGRRRRRPDRLPVGQGARSAADRHRRLRRKVRAGRRERRGLHDQLPHRRLRRSRQGNHRRQRRQGGLRLGRQGHLGQVARLPAPVRTDGEFRQRVGRRCRRSARASSVRRVRCT